MTTALNKDGVRGSRGSGVAWQCVISAVGSNRKTQAGQLILKLRRRVTGEVLAGESFSLSLAHASISTSESFQALAEADCDSVFF